MRRFRQVDVFSSEPFRGNPVAVVFDADDQFIGITDLRELVAHSITAGFDREIVEALHDPAIAVNPSTNVVTALQKMAEHDIDYLPVTRSTDTDVLMFDGLIFKNDLMKAHYDVLRAAREEEFGVN